MRSEEVRWVTKKLEEVLFFFNLPLCFVALSSLWMRETIARENRRAQ